MASKGGVVGAALMAAACRWDIGTCYPSHVWDLHTLALAAEVWPLLLPLLMLFEPLHLEPSSAGGGRLLDHLHPPHPSYLCPSPPQEPRE